MEVHKSVVVFLLICLFVVVFCEDELIDGDNRLCTVTVREVQLIKTTYRCGKRPNLKICSHMKRTFVPTKKTICCDGWKFFEGKCIPDCKESCFNAKCTGNNTCTCEQGFERHNETHCAPLCPTGYYNDLSVPTLDCVSKCSESCVKGICTDFDICTCNPGLQAINTTHCAPLCLDGYFNDFSDTNFTCKSKCSQPCVNGICTDFDRCTCNEGYRLIGSQFNCEPECRSCENGQCVAPNNCVCDEGYTQNKTGICVPTCSNPCENGYCSAPEMCKCNPGYSYDEGLKFCIPVCKETCVNASCIAPDKCGCWNGYISSNISTSCKPNCSSCSNGQCIAPDLCYCDEGYERYGDNCELIPLRSCKGCDATCNGSMCTCANQTICISSTEEAIVASTPTLAGLQLTWMLGGALGLLMIVIVLVIIHRNWRKRKDFEQKANAVDYHACDSVMFTRSGTLLRQKYEETDNDEADIESESRQTNLDLLPRVPSRDYMERI